MSQCECDEMCKEQDYVRTLSGTVCGCARCERHAIVDVLCRPVVNVVIGVHIVVLFVPLVIVHFVVLILLVVILYQFISLFFP